MLIGLLGFAALTLGAAVFFLQRYANPEPSVIQQRLTQLKERQSEAVETENMAQIRKLARLYKAKDYQNEDLGKKLEQFNFFNNLKLLLQQADIKIPPDKYFLMYMAMPIGVCLLLGLVTRFIPLMLGGFVIAAGAYFNAVMKRGKRLNRFTAQMPDALLMICSALRAGHSFQSALTVVSNEMSEPIAGEFSTVVKDINLGIPVKEAMGRLSNKLNSLPDVRMFVTAVMIQREAGGNLAEVLEKLGYTIRERFKLKGQIAALTGQSRMTGYVLGGAPAMILAFLSLFMYDYVRPLYETDIGKVCLGAVVLLQAIGFFIMKKIIDIRV